MIEITDLTKRFNKFTALQNVNLNLHKGQAVALIGPNGCGKTTLIKSILGLNVLESGDIKILGNSIKSHYHYREHIGYMPQIGRYPENMTIGQTLDFIKNSRSKKEGLDLELFEQFNLEAIKDKKMRTLSGGTRQKVSAVLAFLFDPPIVILDEPTAGLDPIAAEVLKEKILKEKKRGKLILITSHLLSELDDVISEMVFMSEGKVLLHQSVDELKASTATSKVSQAILYLLKKLQNNE